ncbi:hypothetical protein [Streptomyces ossamyceticus]|nr:hypothetical protein [Streptomyces ossamyceticus]
MSQPFRRPARRTRTRIAVLATGAVALVTAATVTVRVLGEPTHNFAPSRR